MKMKQNSQSKAIIAMASVIVLLAILSISLTFAYFTAQDKTTNGQTIKFDTLTLDVTEDTWTMAGGENETVEKLVPGCTINMAGEVELAGAPAYLKVAYTVDVTNGTGTVREETINVIKTALGAVLNAQTASTGKWIQDNTDKAWYCVVANNAGTVIDFTEGSVTIPLTTTGNDCQGATIKIGYTVSAIQSEHTVVAGDTDAAKAASLKALFDGYSMSTGLAN
ncbi:MAG: hypothetical protein ACI4TX_03425 [Christensenellales bacterium]